MAYGFSFTGFLFFLLFLGPSFSWVKLPGYDCWRARKKWVFRALERIGITAIFCTSLIFKNCEYRGPEPALALLVLAWVFLILYEIHWLRCRKQRREPMVLLHIPMTVLPVLAYLFLAAYGRSFWLLLSTIVFGIGHVFGTSDVPEDGSTCACCCGQDL